MKIKKILIANRAEIALRVISTCKEMGIKTVTIYSEADKNLPHSYLSDESYPLGDGTIADTYLNKEKILEIAKKAGADAIHPGYGFLSENTTFSKMVTDAGIIFIGPRPDSIEMMGDKIGSKKVVEKIQVPMIPGYHGDNQTQEFLKHEAVKIGFPVLIKASAGGGGKGMRIVENESEFIENLDAAKREALKSFGDDKVLLEKYLTEPRHIEVQMMSDNHGNHLHFFERECSIQRRYQKVIEESPSISLDDKTRKEICEAAVKITTFMNYSGAGTMEFIYEKGKFFFLEMNTRLQVEHPITEMVTGYDLVKLQILVASGEKLSIKQSDIKQKGHSIEVRIYAEDPDQGFMPTIGKIQAIGKTSMKNVRLDTGFAPNTDVTVNYDPMLAKLIVWSETRDEAIEKMIKALDEITYKGLKTNRDYLKRILAHSEFKKGNTFTNFVKIHEKALAPKIFNSEDKAKLLAVYSLLENGYATATNEGTTQSYDVWKNSPQFRNV
ncbi:MAG: acetyl-CoA carboxylase biotin carboxylase subunit [Bacteriovoracaceae bacterium]